MIFEEISHVIILSKKHSSPICVIHPDTYINCSCRQRPVHSALSSVFPLSFVKPARNSVTCSVLNKLTLLKFEIHMEELKKKYTPYTESERMSYIREYLSTSETKYQFAKRTGICRRLLILWLDKYHINDKVMSTEQPSLRKDSDESLNELEKELAALRAENRKLQRALQEESLRHEACEELINLAESTYHIKVRKNSDAK